MSEEHQELLVRILHAVLETDDSIYARLTSEDVAEFRKLVWSVSK